MYAQLAATMVPRIYGMGLTPMTPVMPVTTGMEIEAAAVLLESSERKQAKYRK